MYLEWNLNDHSAFSILERLSLRSDGRTVCQGRNLFENMVSIFRRFKMPASHSEKPACEWVF